MTKSNKITAIVIGAAAGLALVKFFSLPKEERENLIEDLKETAHELIDDAEGTVRQVKSFVEELKLQDPESWIDQLYVIKKALNNFFGEKIKLLN